ncbi:restriction endonuclease subunit S [Aquaspirillum soli]
MSSEWPTVAVEDVCDLIVDCVNKTAPVIADETPFRMIRTTNVRRGQIDLSECRYVDENTYEKWTRRAKLQRGDVILTREAPIGEVGLVKEAEGVFLGQRLMQYRANPKVMDPRFLLYSFLSPSLQHQFGSHEGSGSVVSHIRVGDCFKFKLRLPPIGTQREIAATLGALDDRITLLRETNATLEAIAQVLFKSWFVDFDPVRAKQAGRAPEGMSDATAALFPDSFEESELGLVPKGWRVGTLGDVAQTARQQMQVSDLHADLHYIGLEHMPRKSLSLTAWGNAEGLESAKAAFSEGDILFGKLRPYFHKVVIAPFSGVCSTDILVCQPRTTEYFGVVAMHLFSETLIEYANRLSNGAKMPRVNWKDLAAYPICIQPTEVAMELNEAIRPLVARMNANIHQAQTLATLRDTMLPRLISGQLRLPEAEVMVEAAT